MTTTQYKWTVIGAGPAGIAATGRLLDHGVPAHQIAWIDPEFAAGDLGGKWRAVPGNTPVALFHEYLEASPAFRYHEAPQFELAEIDPRDTCPLGLVADPLVWITEHLARRVEAVRGNAVELTLRERRWTIETDQGPISSEKVILAVGSTPKSLAHPRLREIPLDIALNPDKLASQPLDGAVVAVFGSSHSSMVALPNLLDRPVAKVVNFYRSPLRYALPMDGWTLFDDTGLKGKAALWAKEHIDGTLPDRLQRVHTGTPEFAARLGECDHIVYTVGFERRRKPGTPQWGPLEHNPANGIIAPGLFGLGIAYPNCSDEPLGGTQSRVGLQKFMSHLNAVLPIWTRYGL
ncbi:FAD/NAD(P)-binding protein [Segniliparus rugosus]|uniref:FAD-dependent urate hydroxylase HpyO/Asp monooxygenase CreE-like FAD/NAD(P)-binding domain-containing protein n=1 Tax=Segniliparus rugosus (strain ATCC BAA-974 / DSM 45345 / CCUG 50838 / CIP 108380 / JCM 13579 / CDC 945) TaxID=679197 RepID=E5XUB0_SEGRC|nr:FAD/NAD(P)-binding protein [Segniliparus rugosus]EFV12051.1 hypothetical protein HMPREF9336_03082 [Segniliparus rugosus ATCC BAA-974]